MSHNEDNIIDEKVLYQKKTFIQWKDLPLEERINLIIQTAIRANVTLSDEEIEGITSDILHGLKNEGVSFQEEEGC